MKFNTPAGSTYVFKQNPKGEDGVLKITNNGMSVHEKKYPNREEAMKVCQTIYEEKGWKWRG